MNGASKRPSRDRPGGGSGKGTEDTESRHFRDRKVKGLRWQIEIDRVVTMATRDFVWQEPVIQTHDFFNSMGMSRSL